MRKKSNPMMHSISLNEEIIQSIHSATGEDLETMVNKALLLYKTNIKVPSKRLIEAIEDSKKNKGEVIKPGGFKAWLESI